MKKFLVLIVLVAAMAHADRLQYSDRFKVVSPSDPQISPDGKSIAFLATRANMKDNRYDIDLQLHDLATGTQRPLTFERRGVTQPRWSPDGSAIRFWPTPAPTVTRNVRSGFCLSPAAMRGA